VASVQHQPETHGEPGPKFSGACHALLAFDVGFAIDLDRAEALVAAMAPAPGGASAGGPTGESRLELKRTRKTPTSFRFQPTPLRVTLPEAAVEVGGRATRGAVEAVVYDFGAVSLTYRFPFSGSLEDMQRLSEGLYENAALLADGIRRVEGLTKAIRDAITRPGIVDIVEDYAIFEVREMTPSMEPDALLAAHGGALARILRVERMELSQQEVTDALSARAAYGRKDCALIDWNAAFVLDDQAEDTLTVLEFANVELLEMRLLDDRLDRSLDEAYRAMSDMRRGLRHRLGLSSGHTELRRLAQMQVDSAALFEGVNNALKLVGDQFLARVYRVASQRLRLPEWDASILRKIGALESLYSKASDRQTTRRMEVLEWIIILLIAFEVVMGLAR
jgi:hypothetical protein